MLDPQVPGTPQTHAPQPGDRGCGASIVGIGLVCPDPASTLSPFQPGTDRLQVSDLGLADGGSCPGWVDPPAICSLLPDASWHWARSHTHRPQPEVSSQTGQ